MAFSSGNHKELKGNSAQPKGAKGGKRALSGIDEPSRSGIQKRLDPAQAWEKIKPFCSYQERCHSDVKEKLYGYGLYRDDVEQLLSRLMEENYLNEERFAVAFARGHCRMKKWGKIKIGYALKQKGISTYCLKKALDAVDADEYLVILQKLAAQKWELLRKEPVFARRIKCRNYLMQRGFELSEISAALTAIET